VFEKSHRRLSQSLEEVTRSNLVVFKALELTHYPGQESLIDVPEEGIQSRRGIAPVVFDPPPKKRVELSSNILLRLLCLTP
jgi:hypothetical protein